MSDDRDVYNCPVCGLQNLDNNGKCAFGCSPKYVAQEGGNHYQTQYQHWDWVSDIGMGYLPGNATKYVARWRKKNGIADLHKAMTYVDKMIAIRKSDDNYQFNNSVGNGYKIRICTDRFVKANELLDLERGFCEVLTGPCDEWCITHAREKLSRIIRIAQDAQQAQTIAGGAAMPSNASRASLDQKTGGSGHAGGRAGQGSTSTEHPAPFGYDGDE